MSNAPKYQIAFQFKFKQDVDTELMQIQITDQNTFVIAGKDSLQLAPYAGSVTPPMNNMSATSTSLFVNVASAKANQGVEIIAWTTLIDNQPLQITLTADGSVAAYYSVLGGAGGSGALNPGPNSIAVNGNG